MILSDRYVLHFDYLLSLDDHFIRDLLTINYTHLLEWAYSCL